MNLLRYMCIFIMYGSNSMLSAYESAHALTAIRFAVMGDLKLSECFDLKDPLLQEMLGESLLYFRSIGKKERFTVNIRQEDERTHMIYENGKFSEGNESCFLGDADFLVRIYSRKSGFELVMASMNYVLYFKLNEGQICYAGAPHIIREE